MIIPFNTPFTVVTPVSLKYDASDQNCQVIIVDSFGDTVGNIADGQYFTLTVPGDYTIIEAALAEGCPCSGQVDLVVLAISGGGGGGTPLDVEYLIVCSSIDGRQLVQQIDASAGLPAVITLLELDGAPLTDASTAVQCLGASGPDLENATTCMEDPATSQKFTRLSWFDAAAPTVIIATVWIDSAGAVVAAPAAPVPCLDTEISLMERCHVHLPTGERWTELFLFDTVGAVILQTQWLDGAGAVVAAPAPIDVIRCPVQDFELDKQCYRALTDDLINGDYATGEVLIKTSVVADGDLDNLIHERLINESTGAIIWQVTPPAAPIGNLPPTADHQPCDVTYPLTMCGFEALPCVVNTVHDMVQPGWALGFNIDLSGFTFFNCSHTMQLELPPAVADYIEAFLNGVAPSSGAQEEFLVLPINAPGLPTNAQEGFTIPRWMVTAFSRVGNVISVTYDMFATLPNCPEPAEVTVWVDRITAISSSFANICGSGGAGPYISQHSNGGEGPSILTILPGGLLGQEPAVPTVNCRTIHNSIVCSSTLGTIKMVTVLDSEGTPLTTEYYDLSSNMLLAATAVGDIDTACREEQPDVVDCLDTCYPQPGSPSFSSAVSSSSTLSLTVTGSFTPSATITSPDFSATQQNLIANALLDFNCVVIISIGNGVNVEPVGFAAGPYGGSYNTVTGVISGINHLTIEEDCGVELNALQNAQPPTDGVVTATGDNLVVDVYCKVYKTGLLTVACQGATGPQLQRLRDVNVITNASVDLSIMLGAVTLNGGGTYLAGPDFPVGLSSVAAILIPTADPNDPLAALQIDDGIGRTQAANNVPVDYSRCPDGTYSIIGYTIFASGAEWATSGSVTIVAGEITSIRLQGPNPVTPYDVIIEEVYQNYNAFGVVSGGLRDVNGLVYVQQGTLRFDQLRDLPRISGLIEHSTPPKNMTPIEWAIRQVQATGVAPMVLNTQTTSTQIRTITLTVTRGGQDAVSVSVPGSALNVILDEGESRTWAATVEGVLEDGQLFSVTGQSAESRYDIIWEQQ